MPPDLARIFVDRSLNESYVFRELYRLSSTMIGPVAVGDLVRLNSIHKG